MSEGRSRDGVRTPQRRILALALLLLLTAACGGGSAPTGTDGGSDPDPDPPSQGQNEAPSATITSPSEGASYSGDEAIDFEGSATDPEDGSLPGSALEWESDVDGALGTGASLSRGDLSEGGHTITLTATDGDGATGTDQVQIDVEAEASAALLPLQAGRMWRYTEDSESTVCASSTGCDTSTFVGRHFVVVEEEVFYEGRFCWRVRIYSIQDDAGGGDYGFEVTSTYLSQDATGLSQWTPGVDEWRRVFSTSAATIQNGTFFLVDGPPHDPDRRLTMGTSSATVPYGSFSTLAVEHEFRETGQYATEDIFDSATEHYADRVGMVRGFWDYSYDDNDPAGTDLFTTGAIALTHMDTGPFPDLVPEAEPNDDDASATATSSFSIGQGDIRTSDSGAIVDDADVGCTLQECVHPDVNGETKIQDWFGFEVSQQTDIRITLDFLTYDFDTGVSNDLDLYLFGADGSGGIQYLARAAGPPGEREQLVGTIQPGTYFLGIQAWETPSGRIPFWLGIY